MIVGWWVAGALGLALIYSLVKLAGLREQVVRLESDIREKNQKDLAPDLVGPSGEAPQHGDGAVELSGRRNHLFAMIANGLNDGILVVDEDLKLSLFNKAIDPLFPTGSFKIGVALIEAVRDHRIVDLAKKALDSGAKVSAEISLSGEPREDGSRERVYSIESAPISQVGRSVVWMVVRDVTDRVMTEQIRRDFVANASHELRTPLTLINGYIENLLDGLLDDRAVAEKSLRVMDKHGKRIVRIVEDMLTISKLESTRNAVNVEPFDLVECVNDVIDNLAAPIEEKKAKVKFLSDEKDLVIVGDRFYWDQIFINLIENALKENSASGLKVEVGFRNDGETSVIWVADNGVGIKADQVPFVFKRFFRGSTHHSKKVKGTGLGLSIVKRAVEAHGGTIELKSTPGVRTEFTMRVPQVSDSKND